MSKYTPGPWRELVTRIDDANGYQLCHLDLHGKSETERDANRHLIAAAPDLLEALKYVLEDDGLIPRATVATRAVVRAAIKKATGETL